jgi:hypothetical protein
MTQWLDIESAPRDGTPILVCSLTGHTGTMIARWTAPCEFLTELELERLSLEGVPDEVLEGDDWFYADFLEGGRLSPDCYPTHWQPLPEPPTP